MRMYFKYPDNTFSDLADYPVTPATREGGVWIVGEPDGLSINQPIDILKTLSDMVEAIPIPIIRAYGVDVNLASTYLNAGNTAGALKFIGFIWEDAQASNNPEHIAAIQPIITFLKSVGAL